MYIYILYLCIAYISSHSKGPEQDQLRSPFVPYVRNTAERSIHNFDSGPYVYICKYDLPCKPAKNGMLNLNTRHMCSCVQCLFGNSLDIKEGSSMFIERGEGGCHEAELVESVFSVISLSHVCFLLKSCKVDYLRMTVQVDVVLCILASPNDALIMIHISEKSNMLVCFPYATSSMDIHGKVLVESKKTNAQIVGHLAPLG